MLDTETSRLASLTLLDGGKLVFSPDSQVTLSSDYILIDNEGILEIGTPDCPYAGQAEILLTGERNDEKQIEGFGQKSQRRWIFVYLWRRQVELDKA